MLAVGLAAAGAAVPEPLAAQPLVTVKVTIELVAEGDDLEGGGAPDFYACVKLGDGEECNEDSPSQEALEDRRRIEPAWEFSRQVDPAAGTTAISLEIRDEDGGPRLGDDHVDINPAPGRNLIVSVDLATCRITGDVAGTCGTSIESAGREVERGTIRFRIDVGASPSAPNLNLSCMHGPIWPQDGEPVTVTLEAFDGRLAPRAADRLEIWFDGGATPTRVVEGAQVTFAGLASPGAGRTFSYGCRVFDDGEEVWSGWRVVQVGMPPGGRAIPIVNTGPQASRLDIVFVPDRFWYTGADDPQFLADVTAAIDAYYGEWAVLRRQDHFNFWLAMDAATVRDDCDTEAPANWDSAYTFADSGAFVHRFPMEVGADDDSEFTVRDCAPGGERFFSAQATNLRVFLHEMGHEPFGLADEYCCDGGYFTGEPFPNVFFYGPVDFMEDAADRDCQLDAPTLEPFDRLLGDPVRGPGDCFRIRTDWGRAFASDARVDHLMQNNGKVRGAELRQMEHVFGRCRAAAC